MKQWEKQWAQGWAPVSTGGIAGVLAEAPAVLVGSAGLSCSSLPRPWHRQPGPAWQTLEAAACQMACSWACHVTSEGLRVPP